jgi:signal transduction histidine kinase
MRAMERQSAELWREAAHDLRGNLGVVVNATAGLNLTAGSGQVREDFLRILNQNVSSLHSLLEDVTSLARLQAGHERRQVKSFDAAVLLAELCERMQPLVAGRDLQLHGEGPATLAVEGDAVKVQRIAQNLLLNAIKYTSRGDVTVSWGDSRRNDTQRWMLCVQDTGPGLHSAAGAPMAEALEEATDEARHVEVFARTGDREHDQPEIELVAAAGSDFSPMRANRGEGIGLSIVKRLCELLDATIEMESTPGEGTTLRVLFPRQYQATPPPPA